MHPELLNNSLFLRYYNQWRDDPQSVVFVPIAEYYLHYNLSEEAVKICVEGLRGHPQLVTGRMALAKAYVRLGRLDRAREQLTQILHWVSGHQGALQLLREIDHQATNNEPDSANQEPSTKNQVPSTEVDWQTVTMARILASQGHLAQARDMYEQIVLREPHNETAKIELARLKGANS